jgi:hypothetical protein
MNYNFNQDYNNILTQNTGGYLGGGVGTANQTNTNNDWIGSMFGALPGTLNAVSNLIHGGAPTPNVYVAQPPGPASNNNIWLILGGIAIVGVILVVALK